MRKQQKVLNWLHKEGLVRCCLLAIFIFSSMYVSSTPNPATAGDKLQTKETQQRKKTITGVVVDTAGEPISGASVVERGTTNGTMTDGKGNFSLSVAEKGFLDVSFLGNMPQAVTIGTASDVRVVMQEDLQNLDDVVITGFGLSQKKETLTGAISTIGSKDLARSASSTASGSLVGKIAGVNSRQTDGRPGSGTNISIRNMGNPLYVIDGVQSDGGQFNNIDFNDIEAITVLKDASASIYGVRAANGVVVVTTKKGKKNTKNVVSLNAYYGWQDNFKFTKQSDSKTFVKNYVQAETLRGGQRSYDQAEYQKWMDGTEVGYQGFDWYDYIWNTAPQYYTNVNITGGSDKTNYYISLGHLNQDATIKNYGGFSRTNAQMNIDTQINAHLKIGAGMNGRLESRKNPGCPGGDDLWLPRFAVYRNQPTKRPYANDNPLYPQRVSDDISTNFAVMNYELSGYNNDDWRVIQLQGNAEYDFLNGLKAKALASYYYANHVNDIQEYKYRLYRYDKATDTYVDDGGMDNPYRERVQGYVEEISTNIQLSYDKKIEEHSLNAVAGMETIQRSDPNTRIVSRPTADNMSLITYKEFREFNDNGANKQARLGYMGRLNYNFANKYLVELSGRYDGSWKFPPTKRWGFFPAASVGWRISEEGFWKNTKLPSIVNDLKLRGSYGMVGDDDVSGYSAFDYMKGYDYNQGGSVIDGAYVVGTKPRGLPVTTLSWIKAKILNVGLDASFLDNRLSGQIDYFNRTRTGLPAARYDVLLPSEIGFDLPKENLNSDVNRGVDLIVRWTSKVNDFTYSIAANATYARFYDWEQYDTRKSNSWDVYRNSIAKRYGYVNWGLEAIGQFQSWDEIANYGIDNDQKGNTSLMPGDIKYKDVNGDGVINSMDERPVGYRQDGTPTFNYGLNFAFGYKDFDLAFDFTGSTMNTYNQRWEQQIPFQNNGNTPQEILDNSWHLSDVWDANSELIPGKYPAVRLNNGDHSNYWGSDFWKQNVRYVKLRNLELGYNVPKKMLNKLNITSLRLYVGGSNLFALSNVMGVDPEQQDENGLGYPTMRVVNIGLNFKF